MKSRTGLLLVALAASLAVVPAGAASAAPQKHRLQAFGRCSSFVHYARRHATNELSTRGTPVGGALPVVRAPQTMQNSGTVSPQKETAAPVSDGAGQDFSTTNVQEAGVDEPDQVKTDGKHIFVAQNGRLFALDARSSPPKLLGSIPLQGYNQDLLLSGDRLLVMTGNPIVYDVIRPPIPGSAPTTQAAQVAPIAPGGQSSTVMLVDVSKPADMKVLKTMSVNGG